MTNVRYGQIGGGIDSFIGPIHRIATRIDGKIDLVAGAFSSSPEKALESGEEIGLPKNRIYRNYQEMIDREARIVPHEQMQFVSIVTPNHVHFEPAMLAMENGFHVVCDKPVAFSLKESLRLQRTVEETGGLFCVTHNYTGYPMVKQARHMCLQGDFGEILKVHVEYPQGWLIQKTGSRQEEWRTNPEKSGIAGCMGDIGSHAENLIQYTTGLEITELLSDLTTFVKGRNLEDDGNVLLRFNNGSKGSLLASQIEAGKENDLRIRVHGTKGGFEWSQKEPNTLLIHRVNDEGGSMPSEVWRAGHDYLCSAAKDACRTPFAHPEGYLEAFANVYVQFAQHVSDFTEGCEFSKNQGAYDYPTIDDGVRGMAFIESVVKSSEEGGVWIKPQDIITEVKAKIFA